MQNNIDAAHLIELFKRESCKQKVSYELIKYDGFISLTINYFTNEYGIENNMPNELEIVLDDKDKRIMGIEFETEGDRCRRTPAWKLLCSSVVNDLVYDLSGLSFKED